MLVVGLSGGIASGKSTISELFEAHGVPVVDADVSARAVVQPGSEALDLIRQEISEDCFLPDGNLDRPTLRKLIFANPEAKQRLEQILHPRIRAHSQQCLASFAAQGHAYCLHAIPLLVESGQQSHMGRILIVDCDEETQISRVMARDGSDRALAEKILSHQASRAQRLAIADDIIENHQNTSMDSLKQQVNALHQKYLTIAQSFSN